MRSAAVVLLFALATIAEGAEWDAFLATFGKKEAGTGYHDMPWTVEEATAGAKWKKLDDDKELHVDVFSQPDDPRVMLLFDQKGKIAGIRMAFLKEDVKKKAEEGGHKFEFEYDNNPMYEKGNYFGKDLWHATVLFVSPKKLASGGRASLKKDSDEVAEGLFFKADGVWTELSREECKPNENFVEGSCYPGMGKHYFYKLNDPDCKRKEPIWSLYENGRLVGFGIAGYGSYTTNPKTQNYYENVQINTVKSIVRNAPPCMEDYIAKYGLTSMHVFLKKNAPKIACPEQEWRSAHC